MTKIDKLSLIACLLAAALIVSGLLQIWHVEIKNLILLGFWTAVKVWSWF